MLSKKREEKNLENYLAHYCAPVFIGIKSANIINIDRQSINNLKNIIKDTKVSIFVLYETEEKALCFIYRYCILKGHLEESNVSNTLRYFGYDMTNVYTCLNDLKLKYHLYKKGIGPFPHEIGIMLDYPVIDVLEFIKHQGRGSKMCGYWKVYSNVKRAKYKFECYDVAKIELIHRLKNGEQLKMIANNGK